MPPISDSGQNRPPVVPPPRGTRGVVWALGLGVALALAQGGVWLAVFIREWKGYGDAIDFQTAYLTVVPAIFVVRTATDCAFGLALMLFFYYAARLYVRGLAGRGR